MNPPQTSTTTAVGLVMQLLLSRPANKGENQPIQNLVPRLSASTIATSKKDKICTTRWLFC